MKYYIIVGEASGDLHASRLMRSLKSVDAEADFRFFGGDLMSAVGGTRVKHYRELAYMGFVPVLLHLRTIFSNMAFCKRDIVAWRPDVVILVDYPGFNLGIAKYVRAHTDIPVYYYISPKIWAWKEYRIKNIKRDVDEMFSILPFEISFYEGKHNYPIHYVGNPTADEVADFLAGYSDTFDGFCKANSLPADRPVIALLAGSRAGEIRDNLPLMARLAERFPERQFVVAGVSWLDRSLYERYMAGSSIRYVCDQTYETLAAAEAAVVTSGTATLETALLGIPEVVVYRTLWFQVKLRPYVLKVPWVSLVNLNLGREAVRELIQSDLDITAAERELRAILEGGAGRSRMLDDFDQLRRIIGGPGASDRFARRMVGELRRDPAATDR